MPAPFKPVLVRPDNFLDDDFDRNDEERVRPPLTSLQPRLQHLSRYVHAANENWSLQLLSRLKDLSKYVHTTDSTSGRQLFPRLENLSKYVLAADSTLSRQLHPQDIIKNLGLSASLDKEQDGERLLVWFACVMVYRRRGNHYGDKDIIDNLATDANKGNFARLLHHFRGHPAMISFTDNLQRELATKYPDTLDTIIHLWLDSGLKPDEVFPLLPIAAIAPFTLNDKTIHLTIIENLSIWMHYVGEFRARYGVYSDKDVVMVLVKNRGEDETMAFLHGIRGIVYFKVYSTSLMEALVSTYPRTIPKIVTIWLKSNISPFEVYKMMPIAAVKEIGFGSDIIAAAIAFKWFLGYVRIFRATRNNEFSIHSVVGLLLKGSRTKLGVTNVLKQIGKDKKWKGFIKEVLEAMEDSRWYNKH
ncbi:unnamed protein product [Hyaloperonospora brassicae]|uniref:RxLR effector candidate protein n=1 Tax=Hyaloperonospora brassicae TaxID=162125 RepID=A0AAV0TAJ7_HYABA|nr:unnamed protein product [Hyaloperonospora brassicae]